MEHAAAVGVFDRVADVEEPPEQLAELHPPDRPRPFGSTSVPRQRRWNCRIAAARLSPRMNRIA